MHILFLTHYFPPEVNAPAARTFEHCRRWVRAGHRVTVITCAPNCPAGVVFDGYRNCWRSEEVMEGIRVIRVWSWLAANKGFTARILNYLSYMLCAVLAAVRLRGIDMLVATSPQFFCGWAGVLCRWLRRWPLVLEIRDLWPESIVTVGAMRTSPVIRLLEWFERRLYAAADRIVTVGDGYRNGLLARGVPAEKIDVVPNGVDLEQFAPRPPSVELRRCWQGEGRFVCAYVGTIGMAHGLEVVLDAADRLRAQGRDEIVFWLVGDGAQRERLQREANARGLTNVVFTGLLPKERIPEVLASCDACLVHLKGTELFGTVIPSKLFELMAMQVPIIQGVCGQAQQSVQEAGAGLPMVPDDGGSLLAALDQIAATREEFTRGRAFVAQWYNRDRLAEAMLGVLEQVAGIEEQREFSMGRIIRPGVSRSAR